MTKRFTITFLITSSFVTRFGNAYKVFFIKSRMCCTALLTSRSGTSQHFNTSQCCTYWYYKMLFWTSFFFELENAFKALQLLPFLQHQLLSLLSTSPCLNYSHEICDKTMLPTSKCKHKYILHILYPKQMNFLPTTIWFPKRRLSTSYV